MAHNLGESGRVKDHKMSRQGEVLTQKNGHVAEDSQHDQLKMMSTPVHMRELCLRFELLCL
jgi:hypothetical protein